MLSGGCSFEQPRYLIKSRNVHNDLINELKVNYNEMIKPIQRVIDSIRRPLISVSDFNIYIIEGRLPRGVKGDPMEINDEGFVRKIPENDLSDFD